MTAQLKLQPGELTPTEEQQAKTYKEVVHRLASRLAHSYQELVVESNMTWPNYRHDCYASALTEIHGMYSRKEAPCVNLIR